MLLLDIIDVVELVDELVEEALLVAEVVELAEVTLLTAGGSGLVEVTLLKAPENDDVVDGILVLALLVELVELMETDVVVESVSDKALLVLEVAG
jgi:hypothetical protein